jgi:hypothetical protein
MTNLEKLAFAIQMQACLDTMFQLEKEAMLEAAALGKEAGVSTFFSGLGKGLSKLRAPGGIAQTATDLTEAWRKGAGGGAGALGGLGGVLGTNRGKLLAGGALAGGALLAGGGYLAGRSSQPRD